MQLQKSNKDGAWTPISNEEILYRYTNSYPSTEFMEFTTPAWKPTDFYDADGKSINELIQKRYDSEDQIKNHLNSVSCEISGKINTYVYQNEFIILSSLKHTFIFKFVPDSQNCTNKIQNEEKEKVNKPNVRVSRFQRILKTETSSVEDNSLRPTIDDHKYTKTEKLDKYNEEKEAVNDLVSEQTKVQDTTGYTYDPPPVKENESIELENEFNNLFLEILSKYGINREDKLSNYELSRQPQKFAHQNLRDSQNILYLPVPITHLPYHGHNSPYYVPVNPLLALFLSNFGYHLPGYHLNRVNGKYTNLYGNLASNNVHNNQPLGAYKISSDSHLLTY